MTVTERADEELVALARAGDRQALEALVRRHYAPLRALLLRYGDPPPAEVDDLVQETFVRAFAALERYQHRGHLRTWLFRIAVNLARDLRRKAGRVVTAEDVSALARLPGFGGDPEETLAGRLESEALAAAMAKLPESQREALTLRFYADLSLEEVARVVGCPVGTVKSRLHYSLLKLRGLLAAGRQPGRTDRRPEPSQTDPAAGRARRAGASGCRLAPGDGRSTGRRVD